jgi:hypothetical protein
MKYLDQPRRATPRKFDRERLYEMLDSAMEDLGTSNYDPLVRAVRLAEEGYQQQEFSRHDLVTVHMRIAEYYHAKVKTIELTPPDQGTEAKVRLLEQIKEALD